MRTSILRVYHKQLGGHTHMRVLTGSSTLVQTPTLGVSGDLIMTNEEFAAWQDKSILLQFIEDDRTEGNLGAAFTVEQETDDAIRSWVYNVNDDARNAGSFVCSVANVALRADSENYPLFRPYLTWWVKKYPQYTTPVVPKAEAAHE